MTGINFLRETFRADDAIRVHFYVPEGGQSVNTVPGRTQLEMYVRAKTVPAIFETNAKVTRAIRAGALAINCDLEIQDTPGYFPLHQDDRACEETHFRLYRREHDRPGNPRLRFRRYGRLIPYVADR